MTDKLKPCPFCGGDKAVTFRPTCHQRTPYDPADRAYPVAHCGDCWVEMPGKNWDESCASAVAAWNTRAVDNALVEQGDVEFLRDLATRLFKSAAPAMGFDQGDVDQLYRIAASLSKKEGAS